MQKISETHMEGERERIRALLADVAAGNAEGRRGRLEAACFPDVRWRVACPVDEVRGVEGYCSAWLDPLASAIPGYMRRDEIVMGGVSSTGSGHWVATLGHVVGNFEEDLLGIPGHGKLVFLRCGEFYRIEGGRIAEAVILPDLPDLARQTSGEDAGLPRTRRGHAVRLAPLRAGHLRQRGPDRVRRVLAPRHALVWAGRHRLQLHLCGLPA
jgi:hypothetical protein